MKLPLQVAQESYGARPGSETISVQLTGGRSRYRRDKLGTATMIDVQWFLLPDEYAYFWAFHRAETNHGALPFQIDLLLDQDEIAEYTASFVPGSIELSGVNGDVRVLRAQLEVVPPPRLLADDLEYMVLFETRKLIDSEIALALSNLVNVTMPGEFV